jgi:hypothetical protein
MSCYRERAQLLNSIVGGLRAARHNIQKNRCVGAYSFSRDIEHFRALKAL